MDTASLIVALPSKGLLHERSLDLMERAHVGVNRRRRAYRATLDSLPGVTVQFVPTHDIVGALDAGDAHFGVTGLDLLREASDSAQQSVGEALPLNFGHADVVLAVPEAWIDVVSVADLADISVTHASRHGHRLRIATKYPRIAYDFLRTHGLWDFRLVASTGATEGAPASGAADCIVDITTTGDTLAANALKVLSDGVILRSSARLFYSLRAPWNSETESTAAAFVPRIAAEHVASRYALCLVSGIEPARLEAIGSEFACVVHRSPTGSETNAGLRTILCPHESKFALAEALEQNGAGISGFMSASHLFHDMRAIRERVLEAIRAGPPERPRRPAGLPRTETPHAGS